ncbi:MAG: molybdenum cofactor biosynthesis protein MoaE [Gemmatimonadota bacterium]
MNTQVGLSDAPISAADLRVGAGPAVGAVLTFEGRVRNHNEGRQVVRLHYDAYRQMAEEVLRDIERRTREAYEVSSVSLVHRVGTLSVGEVAVVVSVAAAHRSAAFDGARFAIETVKAELPVWKQEEYEDGSRRWLGGNPAATGSSE